VKQQAEDLRRVVRDLGSIPVGRLLALPVRLPRALRAFFASTLDRETAQEAIGQSLVSREKRFLEIARDQVFDHPKSPYLPLFRHAGCELGDLRANVERHGLEVTLSRLAQEGVYLSADEFKGKCPVVRGQLCLQVSPSSFEPRRPALGCSFSSWWPNRVSRLNSGSVGQPELGGRSSCTRPRLRGRSSAEPGATDRAFRMPQRSTIVTCAESFGGSTVESTREPLVVFDASQATP